MTDTITVKWGEREVVMDRFGANNWQCVLGNDWLLKVYRRRGYFEAEIKLLDMDSEPIQLSEGIDAQQAVDVLFLLLRSIPGMGLGWRSITKAPRDGTTVLLANAITGEISDGHWEDGMWCHHYSSESIDSYWTNFALVTLPEHKQ